MVVPLRAASQHQSGGDAAAPPAVLADRMGFLLKHAQLRYQAIQQPALAPFDLDGRLLAVLALMATEGPALQARLSERLQVDRTTMVALVDALEHRGLVERKRDPLDRRGHQVTITKKGGNVLQQALAVTDAAERDFLDPLSRDEQHQFRALLARLAVVADRRSS
ncbi:MAG: MarR family transcriptional regulator [Candidatus Dormiibacterota bacterium]